MELVTTARLWWKKYSTAFFLVLGFLPAINAYLPFMQVFLPGKVYLAVSAIIGILGVLATQIKQPQLAVQVAKADAKDAADAANDADKLKSVITDSFKDNP